MYVCATSLIVASCGSSSTPSDSQATTPVVAPVEKTEPAVAVNETHYEVTDLVDLDLSANGIPVITKAPKDAKIMTYDLPKSVIVYGGKFFKLTFEASEGSVAENLDGLKSIATNKDVNPNFDKLEVDEKNGFLKKNKDGKLSFIYMVSAGGKAVSIVEGMPYDISPDQFSDYSADDVKLMFEAAKATKAK